MNLIIKGVLPELLSDVYSNDYIIKNIMQDGREFKPIEHPLVTYYSALVDNCFVGCFMHIQFTKYEVELHSLLTKSALAESRELGKLMINKTFEDENVLRITANILGDLKKSINYCKKLGFELEGIKKDCVFKNGIITNIHILGLTREKWSKL